MLDKGHNISHILSYDKRAFILRIKPGPTLRLVTQVAEGSPHNDTDLGLD
jgi:hypothetical protein